MLELKNMEKTYQTENIVIELDKLCAEWSVYARPIQRLPPKLVIKKAANNQ
jgi:hypothetical protein